jgi:type VI protein secretion system component VasF
LAKSFMDKEKAKRIQRIFNWVSFVILVLFLTFMFIGLS